MRNPHNPDRIVLSAVEFDVLWRATTDAALPLVIDVPSPGVTHTERAAIVDDVWRRLHQRGLATWQRTLIPALSAALSALAEHRDTIELRAQLPHEFRAILAVPARRTATHAVVAALIADEVRLHIAPDTGIADTMASILPPAQAGPGHSVTVSTTAYAASLRVPTTERESALRLHGMHRDDARTLAAATHPIVRIGQFAVSTGQRRADTVVGFHDTPSGRYLVTRRITTTTDYLTITPATTPTLANAIRHLYNQLINNDPAPPFGHSTAPDWQ